MNSPAFLRSYEWRQLRMHVLKTRGRRCECCGASPAADNSVVLHVDHIKPRRYFPQLALDAANLQVLCEACNHGKGNWDETDWRQETAKAEAARSLATPSLLTEEEASRIWTATQIKH